MNQRGGAKCELERERGNKAKETMVELTRGVKLKITNDYGLDRYKRLVIDLGANGQDVGALGVEAGALADWPHKNDRALKPKPDWCRNR